MPAHRKSLVLATAKECRERMDSILAQVIKVRALCETARDLRQYNAELRELLREALLTALTIRTRNTRRKTRLFS
jgi:hypothetical protein